MLQQRGRHERVAVTGRIAGLVQMGVAAPGLPGRRGVQPGLHPAGCGDGVAASPEDLVALQRIGQRDAATRVIQDGGGAGCRAPDRLAVPAERLRVHRAGVVGPETVDDLRTTEVTQPVSDLVQHDGREVVGSGRRSTVGAEVDQRGVVGEVGHDVAAGGVQVPARNRVGERDGVAGAAVAGGRHRSGRTQHPGFQGRKARADPDRHRRHHQMRPDVHSLLERRLLGGAEAVIGDREGRSWRAGRLGTEQGRAGPRAGPGRAVPCLEHPTWWQVLGARTARPLHGRHRRRLRVGGGRRRAGAEGDEGHRHERGYGQ